MTGIVVVSHSRPLAHAAVDLATQMVRDGGPRVEIAAGLSDTELGTDATAISEAIDRAMAGHERSGGVDGEAIVEDRFSGEPELRERRSKD